ncbi:M23 family metallopeptidase [Maledivibacter halophilus]|uniref:Membrane proteins related to metalloendopeptidases n=1 Tax=Maledivibacter halophilus TaxID=36842 RepID=A0A1T5IPP7_9FIRM|nr:M23 family metallopeptidase [Maledivibacter halophilus]SKC41149.1 Membrane proteins related to metalloendopeptidases [Maledivibacter halophilus]
MLRAKFRWMMAKRRNRPIKLKALKIILTMVLIIFLIILMINIIDLNPNKNLTESPKKMYIPYEYLKKAYIKANNEGLSFSKLLTYSANEADFNDEKYTDKVLSRAVKMIKQRKNMTNQQRALYDIYSKIFDDLRVGPIPEKKEIYKWNEIEKKWELKDIKHYSYTSTDDFGASRTYGGDRKHEGNDLIATMGTPIVSMTDGVITRLGWNEYGGKRIGITSNRGTYFYYAHMDRYEEGMKKGKKVKAGDVIGYIGDTGYGPVGTKGKIPSHLHIQIGFKLGKYSNGYTWFNPYDIIKFLDNHRITLVQRIQGND